MFMLNPFISFPVASGGPTDSGKLICGTGSNNPVGNTAWATPTDIEGVLGLPTVETSISILEGDDSTQRLIASNFGLAVPDTGTILGVETFITLKVGSGDVAERDVSQLWNGGLIGTTKSPYSITSIDVEYTDGSATDMWGLTTGTLTPAIVNLSTFGFATRMTELEREDDCDCIATVAYIKVYYTT